MVGYEIDIIDADLREEDTNNVTNYYHIHSQFPFPLSGILYSPAHVIEPFKEYEFELISFVSSYVIEKNDNSVEDTNILIDDVLDESVDDIIIDTIIEDNIIIDDTIEENVVDEVIDDDPVIVDDDTTDEIIIEVDENITIEEVIEDADIIVENVIELETHDDYSKVNNPSITDLIGLVLLSVIILEGFVYYKKYKNNNLKSHINNNSKSNSVIKTVHFDDHVTIKINCKKP